MKTRILVRSSVSPFEVNKPLDVIRKKKIGNNTGNLLFPNSITRTLYTEETEIDFVADKIVLHDNITAEDINEKYDYLVLPMANSFRASYIHILDKWSLLIEKLTIPCIVTGIGIQMPYEPDITEKHSYDESAKRFITAVLNHSASVGVRGEITKSYLNHLGFEHIDVIGCPSIEMFGPDLPIRDGKPLTADSTVCVTGSVSNPENFKKFIKKNRKLLPDYYFMPQYVEDLRLMYLGVPLHVNENSQLLYPHTIADEVFIKDRARFFIDLPSILEFNKNIDCNYGTRIHGAIGSILAGVPSFIFPTDARVRELAEYHNIPNMPASMVDENTDIFDIYEKTDFNQVNKGYKERFWHFINFLNENGLPHVYQDKGRTIFPYDEKIKNIQFYGPIHSLYECSKEEMIKRISIGQKLYIKELYNQKTAYDNEIESLKQEIKENRPLLKKLRWYENSSAIRIAGSRIKHGRKI